MNTVSAVKLTTSVDSLPTVRQPSLAKETNSVGDLDSVVAPNKRLEEKGAADSQAVTLESAVASESQSATLESAVARMNDHIQNLQRNLQFTVDEESGKDVVTVVDSETDEVIRQIPSEEALELARRLHENEEEGFPLFRSFA